MEWFNTLINVLVKKQYLLILSALLGLIFLLGIIHFKPALVHFDDEKVRLYFFVLYGIIFIFAFFLLLSALSWLGKNVCKVAFYLIQRRIWLNKYRNLSAPAQSFLCDQIRFHKKYHSSTSNRIVLLELQDNGFLRFSERDGWQSVVFHSEIYNEIFDLFSEVGFQELEKMIVKEKV